MRHREWEMSRARRAAGRLRVVLIGLALGVALLAGCAHRPQGPAISAPVLSVKSKSASSQYAVAGNKPEDGGTTTISTALVPLTLVFDASADRAGQKTTLSVENDLSTVLESPIFQPAAFPDGFTQYGDAVQRAEFYGRARKDWHTLFGRPVIASPLEIEVPAAEGYLLRSRRTGRSLGIVDLAFVEQQLFKTLPTARNASRQLVIALARDTEFYPLNDATVCCAWGAHGVHLDGSKKFGQAFVLGTYLDSNVVPGYADVQPLSEQLAEWMNDPLQGYRGNTFPAWRKPGSAGCGGRAIGTSYRFAEPTDAGPATQAAVVVSHGVAYHLANVALLPWFTEDPHPASFDAAYSFPDLHALSGAAEPCRRMRRAGAPPTASPLPHARASARHELIGYWVAYSRSFPLRDVSPQWDVVIVAFAPPVKGSTSRMQFRLPVGYTKEEFRSEIQALERTGRKVLISLGGGGRVVTLNTAADERDFVSSVSGILRDYGFDGVDLDFETPSLILNPGDTDFRKPTTPAVVNLIDAMRQLRRQFGPKFMLAEVPEGPQVPAGLTVYGGQFGSFLPVIYGTRDILSFVDVQDYNTPPLEGLDGNYYMPETADYYAAMTEMLLHGFPVGGNAKLFFPPLPASKVAVGFLVGRSPLAAIEDSVRYLCDGTSYAGREYTLARRTGYPRFDGVMFWNIPADRRDNYRMSNAIGPLLHRLR